MAYAYAEDFQEIRQNIEQGIKSGQKFFGGLIKNLQEKLEGEPERYNAYGDPVPRRQNYGPSQSEQMHGSRRSAEARRSADNSRYDNDNRVLGDDFEALELRDDEGTYLPYKADRILITECSACQPAVKPPTRQPRSLQIHARLTAAERPGRRGRCALPQSVSQRAANWRHKRRQVRRQEVAASDLYCAEPRVGRT